MDPRVLSAMTPYFLEQFGNPHAEQNAYGQAAAAAVESARASVASLVGAEAREVIFTSGATESNNLLIRGTATRLAAAGKRHLVTCATEHKSVLAVFEALAREGFEVSVLPVSASGRLSPDTFASALRPSTGLASIMAANNEIGVLHPLEDLGRLCRSAGVILHSDAAQAAGKTDFDLAMLPIDLVSLSSHKLYGPMGIGAAIIRRRALLRPAPLFAGGGQEGGLRPGTTPTALCVGFGVACEIARIEGSAEALRLETLRDRLLAGLAQARPFEINGELDHRLPGNLNLSFEGVDAEALLMTVREYLALSTGSACTAASLEPSHVVQALGFGDERAEGAVRIGLGRSTTAEDVDRAAHLLAATVSKLRRVSYRPDRAVRGRG